MPVARLASRRAEASNASYPRDSSVPKNPTLGMPQVLSTEFCGAAAVRMSAYEQFLRLMEIGRLLADPGPTAFCQQERNRLS
jgi:hypothetical protein